MTRHFWPTGLCVLALTLIFHFDICHCDCDAGYDTCDWYPWDNWKSCSKSCGGGTQYRYRSLCCKAELNWDDCIRECRLPTDAVPLKRPCNQICYNRGTYSSNSCHCTVGYYGTCCEYDVNECISGRDNCHPKALCTNTQGSFTCRCNTGYSGNGISCTDINECTSGSANCHPNALCTNTAGSYKCDCKTGYTGNGVSCSDINECVTGGSNCHKNAECINTAGSFTCTCRTGYTGNGIFCSDINECNSGMDNCDSNAVCNNTVGSFTCTCKTGYTGNGVLCSDINECVTGGSNCHKNAECNNTPGSFTCTCRSGYTGNGISCSDINECTTETHNCSQHAHCSNTDGSFDCSCIKGYHGDGVSCTDTNECTDGTSNCHTNAMCTNTPGSFTCKCRAAYIGNGTVCIDCRQPLWEHGVFRDQDVTSSSNDKGKTPDMARSECQQRPCGWCPDPSQPVQDQYIEVTLNNPWIIQAIEIQPPEGTSASAVIRNYMTNYTFQYQPVGGTKLITYGKERSGPIYMLGVRGTSVTVVSTLTEIQRVIVQRFRIAVVDALNKACFRFKIFGCKPQCDCENGGSCLSWNTCLCPPPYYGPKCHFIHLPEKGGCLKPLGMWNDDIKEDQLIVSSSAPDHGKNKARYICCGGEKNGAWCPASNDTHPFFEVKLTKPHIVAMLMFEQPNVEHLWELPDVYMKTFNLEYHNLENDQMEEYASAVDAIRDATVSYSPILEPYLFTDVIRIVPDSWEKAPCFRVEIIGCDPDDGLAGVPVFPKGPIVGRRKRGVSYILNKKSVN